MTLILLMLLMVMIAPVMMVLMKAMNYDGADLPANSQPRVNSSPMAWAMAAARAATSYRDCGQSARPLKHSAPMATFP